ncbi:MAG: efflux RND transporter periplasmic adaptor subunit [Bryobacterales bacterium]|nr:efflux RND transporter periplasmic adaptor subunit [Bryobacterales bacterium]MBV9398778.1 efflux RND transporter periplasmic adaptor subunit [Bryobacterales bacterium]
MKFAPFTLLLAGCTFSASCGKFEKKVSAQESLEASTGPLPVKVEPDLDANNFKVEHPERFQLAAAGERVTAPELAVTGVVSPDISRQVPVPSLATGRIVEIDARLGDEVNKGQLLFKIRSTDIAGAYSDYQKAVKNERLAVDNEHLAKIQQDRAHTLFENGAVPKSALEIADNNEIQAITALENAKVDTVTATEHLKLLGSDPEHPSGIVEVFAPVSGTITDQQITDQSGVQALTPPNPFTISDMSHVWIVCDVWENNMSQVKVGEYADIRLAAYPDRMLRGRINNILPIIDPNIRTAKVRIEVENPGLMRLGMFVTAVFRGDKMERRSTVPATAILHLHDREWVYTPTGRGTFKRLEVVAGSMLPGNMQEIVSGLEPGSQVVANALVFQNTVEQ